MDTNYIIETKNLTKQYGSQKSVADLNIHVKRGRIYGLLGRNGAGKTTTMKMLLGLTKPTSGEVKIWGKSLQGNEKKLLPRIGSLIESPGFYPNLTGTENLRIFATLRGVPNNHAIKDALDLVGLPYKDKKLFSQYSLGMKQRLAIALAVMHDPELLILDEPINGLDPIGIAEVRSFIRELCDANTDVDAVNGVMSSLFQLSAYLLLMPLLVILASNLLFEELDNDTLKNLVTIPINRTKLVLSKMLVLLLFAVGFMAVGGLVNLAVLLFQGWEPVGFWILFGVGIEEGLIMWVGALPCILLVVLLNKNYIVSVVITFFYTTANYILSMSDAFLTQPFGLNIGTLFPGPLAFRWTFQFYDQSQTSAELADLLERISPYFLNSVQVFGVIIVEAIVFLALIAMVYRRQEI